MILSITFKIYAFELHSYSVQWLGYYYGKWNNAKKIHIAQNGLYYYFFPQFCEHEHCTSTSVPILHYTTTDSDWIFFSFLHKIASLFTSMEQITRFPDVYLLCVYIFFSVPFRFTPCTSFSMSLLVFIDGVSQWWKVVKKRFSMQICFVARSCPPSIFARDSYLIFS